MDVFTGATKYWPYDLAFLVYLAICLIDILIVVESFYAIFKNKKQQSRSISIIVIVLAMTGLFFLLDMVLCFLLIPPLRLLVGIKGVLKLKPLPYRIALIVAAISCTILLVLRFDAYSQGWLR